ncbi:hypothetical protein PV326_007234 [Microctonus aethiopoides]|nr:hypothetical protein PV326_007234 [Microctonus aethiopoides]
MQLKDKYQCDQLHDVKNIKVAHAHVQNKNVKLESEGNDQSELPKNTTLGNTLQESLDELIQYGQITPQLAIKVLLQFDKAINQALANRVKSRLTFKAGKLNTYRFCDNVWTFMLNDVEFREVQEVANVGKVKIVACDGKTLDSDVNAKR